jgi:hypothetical protein
MKAFRQWVMFNPNCKRMCETWNPRERENRCCGHLLQSIYSGNSHANQDAFTHNHCCLPAVLEVCVHRNHLRGPYHLAWGSHSGGLRHKTLSTLLTLPGDFDVLWQLDRYHYASDCQSWKLKLLWVLEIPQVNLYLKPSHDTWYLME